MPPSKAVKLLKDYQANNFNATKTLKDNGYKDSTANKEQYKTMARAQKVVKSMLPIGEDRDLKETSQDVLALIGYTREDVIKELLKVINQDKDLTNKLKAMSPLLKAINYNLDDSEQTTAPTVNITVEKVNTPTIIDSTAIQSDSIV